MYMLLQSYIIDIFAFKNERNHTCCSTGFYFKSKILKGSQKMQVFLAFGLFFRKMYLFEAPTFSLA